MYGVWLKRYDLVPASPGCSSSCIDELHVEQEEQVEKEYLAAGSPAVRVDEHWLCALE